MRYRPFILLFIFLLTVFGCADDSLLPEDNEKVPNADMPFTLTFTTCVPGMDDKAPSNMRAIYYGNPTYYEDWVDTQDGIRVLFFITKRAKTGASYVKETYADSHNFVAIDPTNPLKDYFLFESTSRWVTQLPYDEDNTLRYRVTVPVYQIGDKDSEYRNHWERIRELLRTYDFKIAILANHPQSFTWGIESSVLSTPNIDDLSSAKNVKTINDIHHSVADNTYANNTNGNRKDAYLMFVDNKNKIDGIGTMGPFTSWVINRSKLYGDALDGVFSTKETARTWIRDCWIPDLIYNEDSDPDIDYQTLYHNYRHIWSYWNFGGAAEDNALPYTTKSKINTHLNDWEVRNGALLRQWVTTAVEDNNGVLSELSTANTEDNKYDGSMPLTFHPSSARADITDNNGKRLYGVKLPALSSPPKSETTKDCFLFTMPAHGTITVRYTGGTICLSNNGTKVSAASSSSSTINGVKVTEALYTVDIYDKPVTGYIYSSSGTPVVYDIEYTQDQYIYLTDREGILPSSDHPIPMYGVQKFNKLDGWWDEGSSFDLTTGGHDATGKVYNAKTISLLRAVAKIEVLIPKSLGVPKHVYMHSLNASVRCEPMDVATPTNELWKDHNNGCEWKLVQKHGTFLEEGKTSYETNDYKKKLAWYYGNWLEWGWDFNGLQWKPDYDNGPFPRVFNPYISRADCAAFIDVTDYYNDQFYHYLFYMGENTIDASSAYNGAGGSAMIPHIEIRFDERYASTCKVAVNTDLNLMDKDCYHIYFTEGGIASGARDTNGVSKIANGNYETQYETKTEYLKEHWPIMRNHIYRFTLVDNGSNNMSGLVVDAQNRSVDFDFK